MILKKEQEDEDATTPTSFTHRSFLPFLMTVLWDDSEQKEEGDGEHKRGFLRLKTLAHSVLYSIDPATWPHLQKAQIHARPVFDAQKRSRESALQLQYLSSEQISATRAPSISPVFYFYTHYILKLVRAREAKLNLGCGEGEGNLLEGWGIHIHFPAE
ncbi:unnamed protein product [Lactuca saligna]|nr:unnamed protein product [Lactuca saligna]